MTVAVMVTMWCAVQINLAEELEVEADDEEQLAAFLDRRVAQACDRASRGALPSATPVLPLVRLRVLRRPPWVPALPALCYNFSGWFTLCLQEAARD